jgi:hypothetical protein
VRLLLLTILCLSIGAACLQGLNFARQQFATIRDKSNEVVTLPPLAEFDPKLVNIIFLGHKNLYDAIVSIWVTQILNDPRLSERDALDLVKFVKLVSRHKPKLEKTLFVGVCVALMQKLKRPDLCFPVMEEGMNILTESWVLPLTQGYVEGLILKNKERASFFYFLASTKKEVPEYVGRVAEKLSKSAETLQDEDYVRSMEMMLNVPGGERFLDFLKGTLSKESDSDGDK